MHLLYISYHGVTPISNELSNRYLYDEQHDDGEPVEHVVHGGGGEGASKLLPVRHLRKEKRGCYSSTTEKVSFLFEICGEIRKVL
jgi:hypothetical protein